MKKCTNCKLEKPLTEFHKNSKKKDGVQSICKECRKIYIRKHYQENKRKYIENSYERTKKIRELSIRYKSFVGCKLCGEKRWWVLDYHHRNDNKEGLLSQYNLWGILKFKNEIRKCDVLCANCHRDIHYNPIVQGIERKSSKL